MKTVPRIKGNIRHIDAGVQTLGNLYHRPFPHAVGDQVGAGIQKDRTPHMVGPVVVMSHAPQTRLDAADDDGNLPEMFRIILQYTMVA